MRHVLALALLWTTSAVAQSKIPGTVVIIVGAEPAAPVPMVGDGKANVDVADILFLRLAHLGPELITSGDNGFVPELARRWIRRDSLTLAFELDPRARWHDGTPVTSRDVLFAFERARDPSADAQKALLLRYVTSVTAEGPGTIVIRFSRAYAEQLYDAVFHVQPLPAHLIDSIPRDRLAGSAYVQHPIGNGAYRFVRRDAGQRLELAAVPDFFLGRPGIGRVIFLLARDPDAQMNLLLDGTGDALEGISPPPNIARVEATKTLKIITVPTTTVGYLLFNQRASGDRSRAHPILADADVRRALAMGLNRDEIVRAAFGAYASVPDGPVSQLHWIREGKRLVSFDSAGARALLGRKGWRDSNGDGVLDQGGRDLALQLNFPGQSSTRSLIAPMVQEQWRRIGVKVDLLRLDGPVWAERRGKGEFDVDFSSAVLDPSPAGLVQSWTCAGRSGSNVAQYCDPQVDSLMDRAIRGTGDTRKIWHDTIRLLVSDAPAAFLYAPSSAMAVHRRFDRVVIRPESNWAGIWQWRLRPDQMLPRDRTS
jgi:peptide/nickel transport system substrate-binding protein